MHDFDFLRADSVVYQETLNRIGFGLTPVLLFIVSIWAKKVQASTSSELNSSFVGCGDLSKSRAVISHRQSYMTLALLPVGFIEEKGSDSTGSQLV